MTAAEIILAKARARFGNAFEVMCFREAGAIHWTTSDASVIVRYMVQGMTCAEVQEALDRDGVAILNRQGESGVALYDRFVKDGSFCRALSTQQARE